ncbi:hypothetical protein PFISCL1PPCAC_3883, partial [Pristionchus fissidentatus]
NRKPNIGGHLSSAAGVGQSENAENTQSIGTDAVPLRIFIVDGTEQRKLLIECPSETRVCELHQLPDLAEKIGDAEREWSCDGDELKRVKVATLVGITTKRPIELVCKLKK